MLQCKVRRHHLHAEQDSYGAEAEVWTTYTEPSPAIPIKFKTFSHHRLFVSRCSTDVSVCEISICGQVQPQQLYQYTIKWWWGGRIKTVCLGGVNRKKGGERLTTRDAGGAEPKISKCKHKVTLTKARDVNENNAEHSAALSPLTGAPKQLDTPTAAAVTNICPAAASCKGNTGFHVPTTASFHTLECTFHLFNLILPRLWPTTPSQWDPDPRPKNKTPMRLCGYVTVFW